MAQLANLVFSPSKDRVRADASFSCLFKPVRSCGVSPERCSDALIHVSITASSCLCRASNPLAPVPPQIICTYCSCNLDSRRIILLIWQLLQNLDGKETAQRLDRNSADRSEVLTEKMGPCPETYLGLEVNVS